MQPDDVERVPVTVEEVEIAISKLKNGKSPGICGISAEIDVEGWKDSSGEVAP